MRLSTMMRPRLVFPPRAALFFCLAAPLLFLMAAPLRAQLAPSPDAPPVSTAPPPAPEDDTPAATLKLNVNLVSLYFTVKDKSGTIVPHLTKDDCSVTEDKVPQTLKSFNAENNQPLTLGILLDTSYSQRTVLNMEKQAAGAFLERVLKSKDEAFALSVDSDIRLLQDYTSSARQLERELDKAQISTSVSIGSGPVPTSNGGKGTVLYDAVYQASNDKLSQETGRKALILLTDGQDEGSDAKLNEAISAAQKANAIVYVILAVDVWGYRSQGMAYVGEGPMRKMAEETGGRVIDVGNNGRKLDAAFAQIEDELRDQYVASYTPTNTKIDGTFRKIAIQCKGEGLKIQARKGYYALAPEN